MPKKNVSIKTSAGLKFLKTREQTGQTFRDWREAKEMNKSTFAALLGVSPSAYQYIESGKYYPNFQVIAVARQLGFDIAELFDLQ